MFQERLCSLALLSTESQLAGKLDFKDSISDFASEKARRWAFCDFVRKVEQGPMIANGIARGSLTQQCCIFAIL